MRICLFLLFLPSIVLAQFNDDFSDGDFLFPAWTGDSAAFAVVNETLQLQSAGSATSGLFYSHTYNGYQEHEWSFHLKLNFSPSSQNYCRYYLYADNDSPLLVQNALYLQLGESGSNDAPELKWMNSGNSTLLARGINGSIASPTDLLYTVQCDSNYYWTLWTTDLSGNKILQFAFQQNLSSYAVYAGWQCTYTSSNADNFYLDDVYEGLLHYDTIPPFVTSVSVLNSDSILVTWNEAIDPALATFRINGINCSQYSVVNSNCLLLQSSQFFQSGNTNLLACNQVADLQGNLKSYDTISFTYIFARVAGATEIRINELMADPQDANQLPEAEYIELHNTTADYLLLDSLQLNDGTSFARIESDTIAPFAYLVYSSTTGATTLKHAGIAARGLPNFPSLNNSGDSIRLTDRNDILLDEIIYTAETYHNSLKAAGGWSLEKIDEDFPCSSAANWTASKDASGGTPGVRNSVDGVYEDVQPPCMDYAWMPDSLHVIIRFTETMDPAALASIASYSVETGSNAVNGIEVLTSSSVKLELLQAVQPGQLFTVRTIKTLSDCSGNPIGDCNVTLTGISHAPAKGDLLINEVLFNSTNGNADFIELINASEHLLALDSIRFARKNDTGEAQDMVILHTEGRVLLPGKLLAFSSSPEQVIHEYPLSNSKTILAQEIPPLNNNEGTLCIFNSQLESIDQFHYSEKMHYPLLNTVKGVSLERISVMAATDDSINWHSAAATCGYATPGYKNSQALSLESSAEILQLNWTLFSPDNDGEKDILPIQLNFGTNGYAVKMVVYDANGIPVRILAANDLAGPENFYSWDGLNEDRQRCSPGIYILVLEAVHPSGTRKIARKSCVLVSRF